MLRTVHAPAIKRSTHLRTRLNRQPAKSERHCKPSPAAPTLLNSLLLPSPCEPTSCCMSEGQCPPDGGTQWIPHSHVQSTQLRGATHTQSASTQTRRIDRSPRPSYPPEATSSLSTVNEAALQQVSVQQLMKSTCNRSISTSAKPRPSKATLPPAPSAQEAERVLCCCLEP